MSKLDYSQNNYHPEKDRLPGAYEWWYFDGDLHNGYTFNVVWTVTNITGLRYALGLAKLSADPTIPYYALDYATMKVMLMDENQKPVFRGEYDLTADQISIAPDRLDTHFGDKCHLAMKETAGFPDFIIDVEIPDGKGNIVKADLVYSPIFPLTTIGRGELVNSPKGNLYHKWVVAAPVAKVQATFKITDSEGKVNEISESGTGYHDHNWGNHPLSTTLERWYWGRIAEPDMNLVYAQVYNLVPSYPTYKPCFFSFGNNIVTATEEIEFVEDRVIEGVQGLTYAAEGRIRFLAGSGVKGEVKLYDMKLTSEQICYLRFTTKYNIDVETAYGRIKRDGNNMFEYMDLAAAVRFKKKMAAEQK